MSTEYDGILADDIDFFDCGGTGCTLFWALSFEYQHGHRYFVVVNISN
ncbi:hypothetical protein yaldo0001_9630 [Yersinia aldovae ATCC 35236]|nr:hypothetical protein yaldo0001_9630 [Yersinia aldovae ATCC 35236]